jgi:O-methyltransferase domain
MSEYSSNSSVFLEGQRRKIMIFSQKATISPRSLMLQASLGPIVTKAIAVVAQLNIADLLVEMPQSADELARATGTHAPYLYRLLKFLASLDVFAEDEQGRFALTPLSDTLRTDVPDSPRDWILLSAEPWRWELAQAMMEVVSSGKSAYEHIYQKTAYTVFAENPEFGMTFNKAMKSWSASLPAAILDVYDFSRFKTIVDVGGGMGVLLASILKTYPNARGILFDQPHVVPDSKKYLESQNLADRCEIVGGNFLEAVPEGGDLYIISYVLMDWSNEDCITILKNCHRAMASGGKLLMIEPVVGSRKEQTIAHFVDTIMLLETFGRIRDREEWKDLLRNSDFTQTDLIHTDELSMDIIETTRTSDDIARLLNQPTTLKQPLSLATFQRDRAPSSLNSKPLGTYLVEAGLLTPEQVNDALNEQKQTDQRFGEVLSSKGWVRQETIEYVMDKVVLPERQLSGAGVN